MNLSQHDGAVPLLKLNKKTVSKPKVNKSDKKPELPKVSEEEFFDKLADRLADKLADKIQGNISSKRIDKHEEDLVQIDDTLVAVGVDITDIESKVLKVKEEVKENDLGKSRDKLSRIKRKRR